jgi:dipeptidyl aminopeptidase/acylaminoacyl peptidase
VIYPREGHGIAERAHQQDTIDRILDWLRAHLEPGPADRS